MRNTRSTILGVLGALAFISPIGVGAQCSGWQQRITCDLSVDLNARNHRFTGTERLVYENHSPDTLGLIYFHLYFNAFKPGSEMDVRSRTIADPDGRVADRILHLDEHQQGDLHCTNMRQDGRAVRVEELGTILRVHLAKPLPPGKKCVLDLDFNGQVPVQIRRSGRDSKEGIAYSMTQWFPKVAAYDRHGWHADPYVGREFYGEWGDYSVRITMDSAYTIAASGSLANASEIGHGYTARTKPQKRTDGRLTWHFKAPRVHDFAWSADPDYKHITAQVPDGPLLHFIYEDRPELEAIWKDLPAYMVKSFQFMASNFGAYPYPHFTFAQGGDGGMEYPNLTLITGDRRIGSLVGTSVHESVHNWYYGLLGSDEASFPWMDEGFTEYASSEVMEHLFPGSTKGRVHGDATIAYLQLAASDGHEPMSTHADHFTTNRGYGSTAYSKGEFFLDQLGFVIGDQTLRKGLMRYYDACRFKHPEPVDVQRAMEKESGMQLDWYFDEWINTTRKLDHAVVGVTGFQDSTRITLKRVESMLMPVDVAVTTTDDQVRMYSIPLSLMLGAKPSSCNTPPHVVLKPWLWVDPNYSFSVPLPMSAIRSITIDPMGRTPEVDQSNDQLDIPAGTQGILRR